MFIQNVYYVHRKYIFDKYLIIRVVIYIQVYFDIRRKL